ncbi:MAG: hypothetical protein ACRC0X_00780, partial [Brevinema sp.]
FIPHVQIVRNLRWINYVWYNQQRFINHTIAALGLLSEQLHATTMMTVQNRFALDVMLGPEQGVCQMIGQDCCTVVPLNTGPVGPITQLLERMVAHRDEMVRNNAAPEPRWYNWLFSASWTAGLLRIGTTVLAVLLIVLVTCSCGIPLLRSLVTKTAQLAFGQYMVMHSTDADLVDLYEEMNDTLIMETECDDTRGAPPPY